MIPIRVTCCGLALWLCCSCALLPEKGNSGSGVNTNAQSQVQSKNMQTRNNAASLLHDLLADEQNVSKILLVKSPGPDSKALVEMIARMAAVNLKKLELLSTNDPDLDLSETDLPPGEQASRNAEAKTKEHALLFSSGADFEFNLLLTQAEALNYGANLAAVAADNSPPSEEAQVFKAINGVMAGLYKQVVLQMRSLPAK